MTYCNYDETKSVFGGSLQWELITNFFIKKYGACQHCGSTEKLVVHHMSYTYYPFDKEKDLILLCKNCHFGVHNTDKEVGETIRRYILGITSPIIHTKLDIKSIADKKKKRNLINYRPKFTSVCEICFNKSKEDHIYDLNVKDINFITKHRKDSFKITKTQELNQIKYEKKIIKICPTCLDKISTTPNNLIDLIDLSREKIYFCQALLDTELQNKLLVKKNDHGLF